MILFGGDNPRAILVYGLVVLAILAFSYFVIIKPITDTTNNTINNAFKQSSQIQKSVSGNLNKAISQAGRAQSKANRQESRAVRQAKRRLAQAKRQANQAIQQAQGTP